VVVTRGLKNYSDIHYTSAELGQQIVTHFNPSGRCLDPCRGGSAFYQWLPPGSDWCEIAEGRDFFAYKEAVDWILTNPPFEQLTGWMEHAFQLAAHVVFLIPLSKLFSSAPRMLLVKRYGGIREIVYLGPGRNLGFDLGFPFGAIHFARGHRGPATMTWW
jgi:hypothetical protein